MTIVEPTSTQTYDDEHQKLLRILMDQFIVDGLEILFAAYPGYEQPYKIGRHEPDLLARNPSTDLVSIGEVKLCSDLMSKRTREQFDDFSNRQMPEGSATVPFHILTPVECAHKVWTILCELGLDKRSNVIVWQPRAEGLEATFANISIKKITVKSVTADGLAEVAVQLHGNADVNFIHWFRSPTAHSSILSFDTGACRVTFDSINFTIAQKSLKSAVSLIREWVPAANNYSRAKYEKRLAKETNSDELNAELEKQRQKLQAEIDKIH